MAFTVPSVADSDDDGFRSSHKWCLTRKEIAIHSLQTGQDAPLEVRKSGTAGRGVFATDQIESGVWLCEYKGIIYPLAEKEKHTEEYDLNGEGSYISRPRTPSLARDSSAGTPQEVPTNWGDISTMPQTQMPH